MSDDEDSIEMGSTERCGEYYGWTMQTTKKYERK